VPFPLEGVRTGWRHYLLTALYNGEDELYEVVDEISTNLSLEMTETVFVDWIHRLQRLIDGNRDYVS
jgi:replication-associated recombination protein RarA